MGIIDSSTKELEKRKMTNTEIKNEATSIMKKWDGVCFFMDFYATESGNEFGTEANNLVYEMVMDGRL